MITGMADGKRRKAAALVVRVVMMALAGSLAADSVLADEGRSLRKEALVRAPIETVWEAWTTPEGLATFFSQESRVTLEPGGPYELLLSSKDENGVAGSEGCKVLSYIPQRMLAFEWSAPPAVMSLREKSVRTQVVLLFDDRGDEGVQVTLYHLGFEEGEAWDEMHAYFDKAWTWVMGQLAEKVGAADSEGSASDESAESDGSGKKATGGKAKARRWEDGRVTVVDRREPEKAQVFTMTLPVPVSKVWRAIGTEEGVRETMAPQAEIELRPGGKYGMWPGAPNRVMAFVPGLMLSTSGSAPPEFPTVRKGGTWSAYFLSPVDEGSTRLELIAVGWKEGREWDDAYAYFLKNNPVFLNFLYDKIVGDGE